MGTKNRVGLPPSIELKIDLLECWVLNGLNRKACNVRPKTLDSTEYVCKKVITRFDKAIEETSSPFTN